MIKGLKSGIYIGVSLGMRGFYAVDVDSKKAMWLGNSYLRLGLCTYSTDSFNEGELEFVSNDMDSLLRTLACRNEPTTLDTHLKKLGFDR